MIDNSGFGRIQNYIALKLLKNNLLVVNCFGRIQNYIALKPVGAGV